MINGVSELWNYLHLSAYRVRINVGEIAFCWRSVSFLRDLKFKVYLKEKLTPSLT